MWKHGAAVSGNVDLSNMGMDCYYHRVIAPTSSTQPPALCITWQFASPLFCLLNFSLSSPAMSLLGVTVCLCLSGNLWLFPFWRGIFCCIFVLFLFCKAYDSYCIRASSNNKNSKKLLYFLFISYWVDKITNYITIHKHCYTRGHRFTLSPLLSILSTI